MITVARSRTKGSKGKPAPAKPTKGKGKAAQPERPVKPAPVRKTPAQTTHPALKDPNADDELDELVRDTYDATASWLAAGAEMKKKRVELADKMRALKGPDGQPLGVYKSADGFLVKLQASKEKLSIKRTDDAREIDLDVEPEDDVE